VEASSVTRGRPNGVKRSEPLAAPPCGPSKRRLLFLPVKNEQRSLAVPSSCHFCYEVAGQIPPFLTCCLQSPLHCYLLPKMPKSRNHAASSLARKDTSNVIYVTDAVFCHFTCLLLPHPSLACQVEKISSLWEENAIAAVADSAYTLIAEPEDGEA
jgi:hypothetical protein